MLSNYSGEGSFVTIKTSSTRPSRGALIPISLRPTEVSNISPLDSSTFGKHQIGLLAEGSTDNRSVVPPPGLPTDPLVLIVCLACVLLSDDSERDPSQCGQTAAGDITFRLVEQDNQIKLNMAGGGAGGGWSKVWQLYFSLYRHS